MSDRFKFWARDSYRDNVRGRERSLSDSTGIPLLEHEEDEEADFIDEETEAEYKRLIGAPPQADTPYYRTWEW
jgi:hypothetical protein